MSDEFYKEVMRAYSDSNKIESHQWFSSNIQDIKRKRLDRIYLGWQDFQRVMFKIVKELNLVFRKIFNRLLGIKYHGRFDRTVRGQRQNLFMSPETGKLTWRDVSEPDKNGYC